MGLRFRKSIKLGPGVRVNLGKRTAGLSFGGSGFRYSVSTSGRRTTTVGLPGPFSYTHTSDARKRSRAAAPSRSPGPAPGGAASLPKPGLFSAGSEKRFYEGVQAYLKDNPHEALKAFEAASTKDSRNISDDLFAGLVAVRLGDAPKAIRYLEKVANSEIDLPDQLMQKYLPPGQMGLQLEVSITPRVKASVDFSSLGAALILVELYQETGRLEEAIGLLQQLTAEVPENPALRLSLCDLLFEDNDDQGVIETAGGVDNDSDLSLACLHLKAKALARKGLTAAAIEAFNTCLRRTRGRDPALLKEVRYGRASLYEEMGQPCPAQRDWEKLYAEDPKYRDVAERIGVRRQESAPGTAER